MAYILQELMHAAVAAARTVPPDKLSYGYRLRQKKKHLTIIEKP